MAVTNIKCKHQVCKQNALKVQTSSLSVTCTLSHCCKLQSLSSCCQVQYLEENKGKHCVAGGPTKNLLAFSHTASNPRASHTEPARSSTWEKTKENTGLVVVLPRTYSLASDKHSLTLLPSPEHLILLPGPIPGRKQRKTLCWW